MRNIAHFIRNLWQVQYLRAKGLFLLTNSKTTDQTICPICYCHPNSQLQLNLSKKNEISDYLKNTKYQATRMSKNISPNITQDPVSGWVFKKINNKNYPWHLCYNLNGFLHSRNLQCFTNERKICRHQKAIFANVGTLGSTFIGLKFHTWTQTTSVTRKKCN